ncbi:hypothetical protein F5J12DRAFT_913107 [Pisolithus orientalis]|uniref:uncharacterized protein n=1 Tax=Pisolithus orientalis TaxID=936130 RepID=UPI002224F4D9|nr:uncharacterized protein F5J12DRAFT_913107 [Pisolithus orientalis]KAI6006570.1 hypothetical protein F5J12DRAFT_913107 [Pisolithus orientalis]
MEWTDVVSCKRAELQRYPLEHRGRDAALTNLARALYDRFLRERKADDLNEAITLHRAALELRPIGNHKRHLSLNDLAVCFSRRYSSQRVVNDLEEAVSLARAALQLCPPGHPDRGATLHSLACQLRKRFMKQTATHDLDEAIELLREALKLRPSVRDRFSSIHRLALCLSSRYDHRRVVADLEEAVVLGRAALELYPPGHSSRATSLNNLACDLCKKHAIIPGSHRENSLRRAVSLVYPASFAGVPSTLFELSLHLWGRFQIQGKLADLDEAICLATYVLELLLPGHSDYAVSLQQLAFFVGKRVQRLAQQLDLDDTLLCRAVDNICALADYFRVRFHNHRAVVNLHAAIQLYQYVLQLRPSGHPGRASSLHNLAQCFADRFSQQLVAGDLDKAIALEQQALELLTPKDLGYKLSHHCLTTYLQMKIRSQVSSPASNISDTTHIDIKKVIRTVALEILKTSPTRLLLTRTGSLCNRDMQISHFMSSKQCDQLLSLCTTHDPDQLVERVHTDLSRYFQYVSFSHRWGKSEPSLRDIEGQPIYSMPARGGLRKLQAFCIVACKWDYLWAWSDTCCIDKDSSAELQEAIGSMFAWYRQSALTVVYLSDAPDTGSLGSSEWFKRGWTLQELLAPRTVVFYTQNWSLYKNLTSSNHKADIAVLEELERVTGIETRFLTNFSPGMDDARSRLQWASFRQTTRPEDIAYSLFGIFNLHLPVLYGETAENALGRLLAEIISQSGDISVLDWVGEASSYHSCFPANITSYQALPLLPTQSNVEEHALMTTEQFTPSSALQTLYCTLAKSSLPRFLTRRLALPCIAHHVTAIQLKESPAHAPGYTYEIRAFGLRRLEIILPGQLESAVILDGVLQLVRPWHSKLIDPLTKVYATKEEALIYTLGRPFHALLLLELPHNEYKRIASPALITAQPIDSSSILESNVRIFDIV